MKAEETSLQDYAHQTVTEVEVPKWTSPMQRDQCFVLLGSCFAQYMGKRFQEEGMSAVCNPLGAAYNPESIRIQVEQSLKDPSKPFGPTSLTLPNCSASNGQLPPLGETFFTKPSPFEGEQKRVYCWWANTLLSDTDEARFRETIQRTFAELGEALRQADWLFVTLGTNVCYKLNGQWSTVNGQSGMIVTNCHKVPDKYFEEIRLGTETCTEILSGMVELLSKECPKLKVVFTVSPYRYRKYGFHGSQLAKATLLLAVDEVCKRFPEKASYFPAYEIMMDELRDYRFYAEDMIHPAPEAIDYIWDKLWNCQNRK